MPSSRTVERSVGRPNQGGRRRVPVTLLGVVGVIVLLGLWELVTRTGIVNSSALPSASEVIVALPGILVSGVFWEALGHTLFSSVVGLVIGIAISIPLGTILGSNRIIYGSVTIIVEFLKPIPVVALLPLALLIFGTTEQMKLALIVFGTVWPLLIQVVYGVRSVDAVAAATARSFRVGRARRFLFVTIPSAGPYIATGIRIAGVSAVLLSIVTELVGRASGLGLEIVRAQSAAHFTEMYAYVLLTGFLGLFVNFLLEVAERRVMHWHPSQRKGER